MSVPDSSPESVVSLQRNTSGRDFVVGDLHGTFGALEQLLEVIRFAPERDRLFSVGDLVDRGPDSAAALAYLDKPWFHAVRGNHEDMLLQHCEAPDDRRLYKQWMRNGGDWWAQTTAPVQRQLYDQLRQLPMAMEVKTVRGLAGIVHADLPVQHDWPGFLQALDNGDQEAETTALWSRERARLWRVAGDVPGAADIYCGHTIVDTPRSAGNVHFIDTGAFHPNYSRLTIVELARGVESATSVAA